MKRKKLGCSFVIDLIIFLLCIFLIFHQKITAKMFNLYSSFCTNIGSSIIKNTIFDKFNNTTVSGTQLLTYEKTIFSEGAAISVKTLKDNNYVTYTKEHSYNFYTNKNDPSYIGNSSKFKTMLMKNKNGNVVEVKFQEEK